MKRLRDELDSTDERLARGARVVDSLLPLPADEAALERVRQKLRRHGRRRYALRLVPAVVALLLLVALAANAMLGSGLRGLLERWGRKTSESPPPRARVLGATAVEVPPGTTAVEAPTEGGSTDGGSTDGGSTDGPPPAPASPPPPGAPPPPPPPRRRPPPRQPSPAPMANAAAPAPAVTAPAPAVSAPAPAVTAQALEALQAELLLDAVNAMRRDHDPGRALLLAEHYLSRYPKGPQVEEALVLAVEAAVVQRDPHARSWAEEYLRRYPSGRFRSRILSQLEALSRPREGAPGKAQVPR